VTEPCEGITGYEDDGAALRDDSAQQDARRHNTSGQYTDRDAVQKPLTVGPGRRKLHPMI
jgi:hypothetical protein